VKTDTGADSVYRNVTTLLVEKPARFGEVAPGLTVPGKIEKVGYKGVDTTELVFDGFRIGADRILGGEPGRGFYQMMDGVEVGQVNVAARGCGVAWRAFELGAPYAQQRETFGNKIPDHQAVLFRLAEMGTMVEAAHQMLDSGRSGGLQGVRGAGVGVRRPAGSASRGPSRSRRWSTPEAPRGRSRRPG
jgi:alkylation response protein AidB-like acyl-CoA dehydrogenase